MNWIRRSDTVSFSGLGDILASSPGQWLTGTHLNYENGTQRICASVDAPNQHVNWKLGRWISLWARATIMLLAAFSITALSKSRDVLASGVQPLETTCWPVNQENRVAATRLPCTTIVVRGDIMH